MISTFLMYMVSISTLLANDVKIYCPKVSDIIKKIDEQEEDTLHIHWKDKDLAYYFAYLPPKPNKMEIIHASADIPNNQFVISCEYVRPRNEQGNITTLKINIFIDYQKSKLINCKEIHRKNCNDPSICPVICSRKGVNSLVDIASSNIKTNINHPAIGGLETAKERIPQDLHEKITP